MSHPHLWRYLTPNKIDSGRVEPGAAVVYRGSGHGLDRGSDGWPLEHALEGRRGRLRPGGVYAPGAARCGAAVFFYLEQLDGQERPVGSMAFDPELPRSCPRCRGAAA